MDEGLNVKYKTIKTLEKSKGEQEIVKKLHLKANHNLRGKINKLDFIKIKINCSVKHLLRR